MSESRYRVVTYLICPECHGERKCVVVSKSTVECLTCHCPIDLKTATPAKGN